MTTSQIRIVFCLILGIAVITQSFGMINDIAIVTQTFGLATMGFGFLMIIYGFSPSTAKAIINAIVQIVSIPLKALFS